MPKRTTVSSEVKAKLEAQRRERNKVLLFDLMTRISLMADFVPGVNDPEFDAQLGKTVDDAERDRSVLPGFSVNLQCLKDSEDLTGVWRDVSLRIDSEDWEFESVNEWLDRLQERANKEKCRLEERDAELRKLSPNAREILGFGNWRDPWTKGP